MLSFTLKKKASKNVADTTFNSSISISILVAVVAAVVVLAQ